MREWLLASEFGNIVNARRRSFLNVQNVRGQSSSYLSHRLLAHLEAEIAARFLQHVVRGLRAANLLTVRLHIHNEQRMMCRTDGKHFQGAVWRLFVVNQ
jgi:hypothetical protein